MAYSKFTLEMLIERFEIELQNCPRLFATAPSQAIRPWLRETLDQNLPLATAIRTEKARSELVVMPVLLEVWHHFDREISLFSGVDFPVDRKSGLDGFCDYLIGLSGEQVLVRAPVVALVETKKDDPNEGLAQCIAEMLGAQRFNAKQEKPLPTIYGVTTSGMVWRFLRLQGVIVEMDTTDYYISDVEKIVGIICHMVREGQKERIASRAHAMEEAKKA
jgi:hypothetical protein